MMETSGVIQFLPGPSARMRAVVAIVPNLLCDCHHSGSAAIRVGPGDRPRPWLFSMMHKKGEDGMPRERGT